MSSTVEEAVCVHESVVRGHHIYKAVWNPIVGETHCLQLEEGNEHDCFAVCVKRGGETIGHVPRELSS